MGLWIGYGGSASVQVGSACLILGLWLEEQQESSSHGQGQELPEG